MIRFATRTGPNSAVSGGLFALTFYALFVWPFVLVIKICIWIVIGFVWVIVQSFKAAGWFIESVDRAVR